MSRSLDFRYVRTANSGVFVVLDATGTILFGCDRHNVIDPSISDTIGSRWSPVIPAVPVGRFVRCFEHAG
jgi:hypothetical protein